MELGGNDLEAQTDNSPLSIPSVRQRAYLISNVERVNVPVVVSRVSGGADREHSYVNQHKQLPLEV